MEVTVVEDNVVLGCIMFVALDVASVVDSDCV